MTENKDDQINDLDNEIYVDGWTQKELLKHLYRQIKEINDKIDHNYNATKEDIKLIESRLLNLETYKINQDAKTNQNINWVQYLGWLLLGLITVSEFIMKFIM